MTGKLVAGGFVIHSNATCLWVKGTECFAHLLSTEVGIFYAILQMTTSQIDPLFFNFQHTVDFCGLDATLLGPLITAASLAMHGMLSCAFDI